MRTFTNLFIIILVHVFQYLLAQIKELICLGSLEGANFVVLVVCWSDNAAHQQTTSMTRSCTFKLLLKNKWTLRCYNLC
jgi:hypothetical protein